MPELQGLAAGLFLHSPVPYAVFRADGHCAAVNPAYRAMFGRPPPPEYNVLRDEVVRAQGLTALVERAFAGETVSTPPFWYDPAGLEHVNAAGVARVAIACTFFPLQQPSGVTHVAVSYRDVTAELRAREDAARGRDQLELAERRLAAVTNNATVGLLMMDARQHCVFLNPAAEAIIGFTLEEVQGRPLHEVIHHQRPDGTPYPMSECPIDRALPTKNQTQGEDVFVRRDGSFYPVAFTASPLLERGTPVGTVIELRDLTEERRLARARVHAERLATTIAANATSGLLMMDERGHCTFMNPAAEAITGYTLDEVQGRPLHDVVHALHPDGTPYPKEDCPIERALPTRAQQQGEDTLVRRDGSFYPVAFSASPIMVEGVPVGTVIELRDTTEDKRRERERERLMEELRQAVQLRDDFLSIASHELRTPLTPLALKLEVALRSARDGDVVLSLADVGAMKRQVRRLAALVEDLLDVTRMGSGMLKLSREPVDLGEVAREVCARFELEAQTAGCTLSVSAATVMGEWDRLRIEQVVSNLLSNALKYGAGQPIELQVTGDESTATLTIRDRGIGIPERDLERIFGKFERAVSTHHYGGLGLGLFVTREIVRAHGGEVVARNSPGGGAFFVVQLPRLGGGVPAGRASSSP